MVLPRRVFVCWFSPTVRDPPPAPAPRTESQPEEAVQTNRSRDPCRHSREGSFGEGSCRWSRSAPSGLENSTVGEEGAEDGDGRGRGCRSIADSERCRAGVDMIQQPQEQDKEEEQGVDGSRKGAGEHFYLKLSSTVERPNRFIERSLPFFNPLAPTL